MGCALAYLTSYPNLETMGVSPGSAVCPMCSLRPRTLISRVEAGKEGSYRQNLRIGKEKVLVEFTSKSPVRRAL